MPFKQPGARRVHTFTASFDSEGDCGHEIYEGDQVAYLPDNDGSPSCEECVIDHQRENEQC